MTDIPAALGDLAGVVADSSSGVLVPGGGAAIVTSGGRAARRVAGAKRGEHAADLVHGPLGARDLGQPRDQEADRYR